MSLKERFPQEIPEDTARVVELLLAADSVYRLVEDCAAEFLRDGMDEGLKDEKVIPNSGQLHVWLDSS